MASTVRRLRDSAKVCPHHCTVPGEGPLRCQLDVDHEGPHAHECMRWGSQHSDRPANQPQPPA